MLNLFIGDACDCARRLRFGFTRVTNMRMNVLYITLLGSDAQESRGSFCKNYVIKMIKRQSFRAYTESITPYVLFSRIYHQWNKGLE